ncbi:MAG TPA: hypothetical protein DEV93_13225 [Chloroflexi bacterium]|nr:hypothetical protein [Chloroflexota bacterium]
MSRSHDAAARQWPESGIEPGRYRIPSSPPHPLSPSPAGVSQPTAPQNATHYGVRGFGVLVRALASWRSVTTARAERTWLALVAVPLAMTASMDVIALDGSPPLWIAWLPLAGCAWWWAPRREFRWAFLLAVEAGGFGVQWSLVGAFALAEWPGSRNLVGGLWIGTALLIAGGAALNRWRYHSPGG